MKLYIPIFLFFIMSCQMLKAQVAIIPYPLSLKQHSSDNPFLLSANTVIIADSIFLQEASILVMHINQKTGYKIVVSKTKPHIKSGHYILLQNNENKKLPLESYQLQSEETEVLLKASHKAGMYYGTITLLQLLTKNKNGKLGFSIPAVEIQDQPRFGWRGLMLDCSRTFISTDYLKRTIERMSFYKLNKLHLHLSDDQGWRLEIKKLPFLTSKASRFDKRYNEPKEFEGFYSQREIKDIVLYAKKHHVDIIPEIEAPGHSVAALNAYPELSCSGNVPPIYPYFAGPYITKEIFCAGNEKTYQFFNHVITEVADIFPAGYIHLGGDEAPKDSWKNSAACQGAIKKLGLKNEEQLQGYLMNRLGSISTKLVKRPIGWDEILEGGNVDKNWIVMAWRGQEIGIKAIKDGYDVIMTPSSNLYFDYPYTQISEEKVYTYEPLPDSAGISEELSKHVLGIQACFWSHIDRTESRIDAQIYPRLLALAERSWSDKSVTDFREFIQRKEAHKQWMSFFKILYTNAENDYRIKFPF